MNILQINNTEEFDNSVWQSKSGFTEAEYNKWIEESNGNLQKIYSFIEEVQNGADAETISERLQDIDLYMMGDVINLLSTIKVDTQHKAHAWTVTEDDFMEWKTNHLTPQQKKEMVDWAAESFNADENIGEEFNRCIRETAEKYELEERPVCAHCGRILTSGYALNGYYACPDGDCMAHVLHEHEGVPMEKADEWFTQKSEVENNGRYFTSEEL